MFSVIRRTSRIQDNAHFDVFSDALVENLARGLDGFQELVVIKNGEEVYRSGSVSKKGLDELGAQRDKGYSEKTGSESIDEKRFDGPSPYDILFPGMAKPQKKTEQQEFLEKATNEHQCDKTPKDNIKLWYYGGESLGREIEIDLDPIKKAYNDAMRDILKNWGLK